jgi:hypothetical protein
MTDAAHPLDVALKFLTEDLLRLVDRLGAFAAEGVRDGAKRKAARPNLLRLRGRVQEVAETLLAMDRPAWAESAQRYEDSDDGWRATCESRAADDEGAEGARRCGERLAEAALRLAELADAETAAEAARLARQAAAELLAAATAWNDSADGE